MSRPSRQTVNLHDPRARRSRAAILQAAQEIAADGASRFSVTEITRRASVSKSTFYLHFEGLDDLCFHLLETSLQEILAADVEARSRLDEPQEVTWLGHARVVDHLVAHRALYLELLGGPERARVRERFVSLIAELLRHSMAAVPSHPGDAEVRFAALYVAGGFSTVVANWLQGELDISRDELVDRFVQMTPAWFREAAT